MKSTMLKTALAAATLVAAAQAGAQVTLYEHDDFSGKSLVAQRRVPDLTQYGFNDRVSSLVIQRDRWEVCDDSSYNGRCVVLGPGRYSSLGSMGLNDRITSLRAVNVANRFDRDDERPSSMQGAADYRRRNGERLYTANVTNVRAVMGTPEQRCWTEREEVQVERRTNVPGAVAGAVLGGILGHQIGGGSGRDLATVGGVVAGGAVGSQVNRGSGTTSRDVQRCSQVQGNSRPEYWDVTYMFRGTEHHMQTTSPPGSTVQVNERGEPRTS